MRKRLWLLVCALGVLWTFQAYAQAENGPVPDKAAFAVRVIEATKAATPRMDPRLGDLARELQVFQKDYNSFVLVRDQNLVLQVGGRGSVKLPDGADFAIQLLGFTPGKVARARHVVEMPRMKMTRAVAPGGRTLDVLPGQGRLTIVSTTVERAP